jgi:NodT family efflux transporter outer membrane factor (OMF) lipoprotein
MRKAWFTGAAVAALLSGCAVGPDFVRPEAPAESRYTPERLALATASVKAPGGAEQRLAPGKEIPAQWWRLFHSLQLNRLIERAFQANPDVAAAEATLRQAVADARAQNGAFFPQFAGEYTPSMEKTPSASPYTLHTLQVTVAYTFDFWGLNRRTVEALDAQADYQRFQLQAAYLTLASNVANVAVQEASFREQIRATEEIVKIETELLELLRSQSKLGQIARADVVAQETIVAQTEATLPELRKQLFQQRNQLTALLGGYPDQAPAETFRLAALRLPRDLPLSLPSRLVEQRPDVRAAEASLHAACAQVGVAMANRLPNITLSGADGGQAARISDLFRPESALWSLTGSVAQPLFDGGTLMYKQRSAEAGYRQASAQYRATVIGAFRNVADALRALQEDARALKAAARAERSAAESLNITRQQLQLGSISRASLLPIQQAYQQTRIALIQAQASRLADTVALFQALGGGWWSRIEAPKDEGLPQAMIADIIDGKSKAELEDVARKAAQR